MELKGMELNDAVAEEDSFQPQALERLAFHDTLTGLPNRDLFFDRMSHSLARVRRYETGFAVMMLDLDEFEGVNDAKGYAAGDMVLCDVAKQLNSIVRDVDTVARTGGDEFGILLDGITSKKEAETVALKIIRSMSDPIRLDDGTHIKVGASVGIVFSPQDGYHAEQLMLCADQAMNVAKNKGKGLISFSNNQQTATENSKPASPETVFNDMNLGISIMDAQHMAMANYIQGIIDSLTNGDKSIKLQKRVELLVELCQIHFQTEEDLMKRYNVPGVEEHHAEHQRRLNSLRTIFGGLNFNDQKLVMVAAEIKEWLLGHIRSQDTELASILRSKGVS
jgi:diguanylate cyclase (GGDEF)-like protein/hemerythrin-like metal-binding protein